MDFVFLAGEIHFLEFWIHKNLIYLLVLFIYMYVGFSCMYVCVVPCPFNSHSHQKRVLDHLALELQMVVSSQPEYWDWNPGPLDRKSVLLTFEPQLSPFVYFITMFLTYTGHIWDSFCWFPRKFKVFNGKVLALVQLSFGYYWAFQSHACSVTRDGVGPPEYASQLACIAPSRRLEILPQGSYDSAS